MRRPVLEVEELRKEFVQKGGGRLSAVDGVSFSIQPGEALGLVGESGCGKTTLVQTILGVSPPTSGTVRILGEEWSRLRGRRLRRARKAAQLIFQDPQQSLNPRMSVEQIIEEPLRIHRAGSGLERRRRVSEVLSQAGLSEAYRSRQPFTLSGGEKQRVAIARALALGPRILVADEPVSALDPPTRQEILKLLKSLVENLCIAVLFVSHELSAVRHLCRRTAVMYRGRLVELGPTTALLESPFHPYTQALLAAEPLEGKMLQAVQVEPFRPGILREVAEGHWVAESA